ncbi:lipid A export permease/ATP-binding protein MsbA [Cellvibrio sp. KY-GH-1]|uniref:lipid A export permease/ATP-binding protein MsbA n=1 Tax=Cellvibrio sp. KY-GH-1 TaxID=2303332 RepID=UPI001245B6B8|nr:lipid A export permease/ATP-binding protein MsbA [Cellvibrio sp. KY-GH-1]QEY17106.1 lipid A export permease/ATP-binding protein MsbA [Cellvibrio sp. KY-GH-1]
MSSVAKKNSAVGDASAWTVYKRLLGYVKPYVGFFVLSMLGFGLLAASSVMFVKILENLVNVIAANDPTDRYWVPLQVIGATLLRSLGAFVGIYLMSRIAFNVVHRLRVDVFNHMTQLPNATFDEKNSGNLISIITYNINGVTAAATDAIKISLREGLTVIALFGYLLYTDWRLTLVFILIAPLIGVIVTTVGKRLRRLSNRVQNTVGDLTQVTGEMINGFKVMRSFGGEEYEKQRFESVSKKNLQQNMKIVVTSAANTPLIQLIIACAIGLLIFVALTFMELKDPASFIAYMTSVAGILPAMRKLGEVAPTILKGVAAADSVFTMLDSATETDTGTYQVPRVKGDVRFADATFIYPNQSSPALNKINLQVKSGEVIALVGKSGSGKSTLVSLLNRFHDASAGEICIDNVPVQAYQLRNLREQIALVNQQVTLFNDTVAGNIAYGSLQIKSMDEIRKAADAAYATEFIEQLPEGFNTLIGESGARLSGGQRQRLAIARAILKDAPILILDEATSALDNESERYIQAAMEQVMKGRTTFVVAHRLSTIENADRILVMEQGEIVEQGTHMQLLSAKGVYARLHAKQFHNDADDLPEVPAH